MYHKAKLFLGVNDTDFGTFNSVDKWILTNTDSPFINGFKCSWGVDVNNNIIKGATGHLIYFNNGTHELPVRCVIKENDTSYASLNLLGAIPEITNDATRGVIDTSIPSNNRLNANRMMWLPVYIKDTPYNDSNIEDNVTPTHFRLVLSHKWVDFVETPTKSFAVGINLNICNYGGYGSMNSTLAGVLFIDKTTGQIVAKTFNNASAFGYALAKPRYNYTIRGQILYATTNTLTRTKNKAFYGYSPSGESIQNQDYGFFLNRNGLFIGKFPYDGLVNSYSNVSSDIQAMESTVYFAPFYAADTHTSGGGENRFTAENNHFYSKLLIHT